MTATLFTIGYEKRSLPEFIELLNASRIGALVDVRETPWSHKPGFSKSQLARAMAEADIEYVHAKFAGNPKRIRSGVTGTTAILDAYAAHLDEGGAIVQELEALISGLIERGKRVCLMCFERNPEECHRSVLAARWQGLAHGTVVHLATEPDPRPKAT